MSGLAAHTRHDLRDKVTVDELRSACHQRSYMALHVGHDTRSIHCLTSEPCDYDGLLRHVGMLNAMNGPEWQYWTGPDGNTGTPYVPPSDIALTAWK